MLNISLNLHYNHRCLNAMPNSHSTPYVRLIIIFTFGLCMFVVPLYLYTLDQRMFNMPHNSFGY